MERDQFYRGLRLERQDPARNLRPAVRRQRASLLIGYWGVLRVRGRVGLPGRTRSERFATAGEAEQALRQKLREKPRCGHVLSPRPGQGR